MLLTGTLTLAPASAQQTVTTSIPRITSDGRPPERMPKLLWARPVSCDTRPPDVLKKRLCRTVHAANQVFVLTFGVGQPGSENRLEAFDASTGTSQWNLLVGRSKDSSAVDLSIRAGLLMVSADGSSQAINPASGQLLWKINGFVPTDFVTDRYVLMKTLKPGRDVSPTVAVSRVDGARLFAISGVPAFDCGRVFVMLNEGTLVGVDADTGTKLWEFGPPNHPIYALTNLTGDCSANPDGTPGGLLAVGDGHGLEILNATTGSDRVTNNFVVRPRPTVVDGRVVYFAANQFGAYFRGQSIWSHKATETFLPIPGTKLWQSEKTGALVYIDLSTGAVTPIKIVDSSGNAVTAIGRVQVAGQRLVVTQSVTKSIPMGRTVVVDMTKPIEPQAVWSIDRLGEFEAGRFFTLGEGTLSAYE